MGASWFDATFAQERAISGGIPLDTRQHFEYDWTCMIHSKFDLVWSCEDAGKHDIRVSTASSSRPRALATVISTDGHRASSTTRKISRTCTSQSSGTQPTPSVSDAYSSWTPNESVGHPSEMSPGIDDLEDADDAAQLGDKRKRYQSTDDPMGTWLPFMSTFLDEMLRRDGLGDQWRHLKCTRCDCRYTPQDDTRMFRCMDCYPGTVCLQCVLNCHQSTPLHWLEEWTGQFWRRISLRDLGLIYNFGHFDSSCPGEDRVRDLMVFDTNGIHRIKFKFCTCRDTDAASNVEQILRVGWYPASVTDPHTCATFRVLDMFRLLNVIAHVNGDTFYKTLEAMTDPCQIEDLPDRRNVFARIERQYAFLLRAKRAGRRYREPYPGDLAVLCWACPNEEMNLPENWRDIDAQRQFLYMLIVALDANFRLKNRIRQNERGHPSIGPGSSYFVESTAYKDHLKNYVAEEDISTCIAFAALTQKETRVTTGLRTSGVAGVVCARHELVRPLGMGDLQKGERYSNMDYVLFSAIRNTNLKRITISYDVGCQWKLNVASRLANLPQAVHLDKDIELQFGVPTWHAAVHELKCRSENALSIQEGVGRTDGEGIERTWSVLNPAAWATKEMGEGARHDHLDDKIDHHNFMKNIVLGELLPRKLFIAREVCELQEQNYAETTASLKPEVVVEWQAKIDAWNGDRSSPNPYTLGGEQKNPTEAQVRAELKKEEAEEAAAGQIPIHGTTAAAFLARGLRLEAAQQKIQVLAASTNLTLGDQSKIHERRVAILADLKQFRDLQRIYMPGAVRAINTAENDRPSDAPPPFAEKIRLWFPSDVPAQERPSALSRGLASAEERLRRAQCTDALSTLRRHLHSKQHLIAWRNANAVGQNMTTRSKTLIDSVDEKVRIAAEKYRRSREALVSLVGQDKIPTLKPLLDSDLTSDVVVEDDALSLRRLAAVSRHKRNHVSTGQQVVSWIWTTHLVSEDRHHGLDESVRVNWSKSQLRARRWREEVMTLEEEMRRVLRTLVHMQKKWAGYAVLLPDSPVSHGARAYALKQASLFSRIHDLLFTRWSTPSRTRNTTAVDMSSLVEAP